VYQNVPVVDWAQSNYRYAQRTTHAAARFLRADCINNHHGRDRMNASINRQILLVEKPAGKLGAEHFKLTNAAIPEPKEGEALLRVRYISLDAANRAWMHGATYRSAVEANTVMAGGGIAEVVTSKAPGLAAGDLVFGDTGWQDYAAVPAKHLTKMPKIEPTEPAAADTTTVSPGFGLPISSNPK